MSNRLDGLVKGEFSTERRREKTRILFVKIIDEDLCRTESRERVF